MTIRIGALLSGGGRTLMNLLDHIESGELAAEIVTVISSRHSAAGIERSRERGLESHIVTRRDHATEATMHDTITRILRNAHVDLVCLCGYLRWMRIDEPFVNRVMNIHPSLLPEFGGKGMHGDHVHRAVLKAGRAFTGCTVHLVDEEYDHGPIVLQRACPVLPGDDVDTLAARVFEEECIAYPEAVRILAEGRLEVSGGRAVRQVEVAGRTS